jgi:hypothetical protein
MFEALRKYGSVFMLVLMGMVMMCLVADEYGDSQQFVIQTATSTGIAVVADDFDLDDDDNDESVTITFVENKAWTSIPTLETIGQKTEGSKCSQALLRGQVRRYSPRNDLSDSYNYTPLSITKSGVDLFHATFFVSSTTLLTKHSNT